MDTGLCGHTLRRKQGVTACLDKAIVMELVGRPATTKRCELPLPRGGVPGRDGTLVSCLSAGYEISQEHTGLRIEAMAAACMIGSTHLAHVTMQKVSTLDCWRARRASAFPPCSRRCTAWFMHSCWPCMPETSHPMHPLPKNSSQGGGSSDHIRAVDTVGCMDCGFVYYSLPYHGRMMAA